jgi:hypothetical protein
MLNPLITTFTSSSNKYWRQSKCYNKRISSCMIIIHMFFQGRYNICFIICYQSFFFLTIHITSMHKIIITKQTSHNLRISRINFFIIIYTIKCSTNYIPIMTSPYFSKYAILKVSFHFIKNLSFCISLFHYVLLCLKVSIKKSFTFIFIINFHHIFILT